MHSEDSWLKLLKVMLSLLSASVNHHMVLFFYLFQSEAKLSSILHV